MAGFSSETGGDSIVNADNGSFDGTARGGVLATDGDLWMGRTSTNTGGTHVNVGKITSTGGTIAITYPGTTNVNLEVAGVGPAIETLTGNTGVAFPISNNINVVTENTTVTFVGTDGNLTQDFGLSNLLIGTLPTGITSAQRNVSLGASCLTSLTTGVGNVSIGNSNSVNLTTGIYNVVIGDSIYVGNASNGNYNIILGTASGNSYTSTESSNILFNNMGVVGESNVMRLGTQGTGDGQVNKSYIAGVLNTTSGRVVNVTTPGAYPYTTLITDDVIIVDTSLARVVNLLASPETGRTYRIKDNTGNATTDNITITPNAGNIDGAATYIINNNYGSVDIVYNGTQWNVF